MSDLRNRAKLVRVIDGDTLELKIDLGWELTLRTKVRLADIDTPELKGKTRKEGLKAKNFVKEWFKGLSNQCFVELMGKGKFGRWIVFVYPKEESKKSLNETLVERGLARPVTFTLDSYIEKLIY